MIHALRMLCERHTPTNMENFEEAVSKSLFRTAIWRIDVQKITGKRKKYDTEGKEMKFERRAKVQHSMGIVEMYQPYIDGLKELRDINMGFWAGYVLDREIPEKKGCL